MYNLTTVGNVTGILGLVQTVNSELMQGWFGTGMLLSIFVILMIAFLQGTQSAGKSLAASSFICFALALLLRAVDLIPDNIIFVTLIICAASVAFLNKE